jgi:hypothetical protein
MKDTLYRFGFAIHLLAFLWIAGCVSTHNVLNDLHSRLNPTTVDSIHYPTSTDEVLSLVRYAINNDKSISISGGQHSMGGQQYGTGTVHLNMSGMNDVLKFDGEKGIVTVEAGIQWPELIEYLIASQDNSENKYYPKTNRSRPAVHRRCIIFQHPWAGSVAATHGSGR